jgi:uncharacterized membrane protein
VDGVQIRVDVQLFYCIKPDLTSYISLKVWKNCQNLFQLHVTRYHCIQDFVINYLPCTNVIQAESSPDTSIF